MWLLWVFKLSVRHILVFSLDQLSSVDNDDITILSLSLYLTLKTQHRHVQASSGTRVLRSWVGGCREHLYFGLKGISSPGMTKSSFFSLPLSCSFCPCFLISSSLPFFKVMTICSSCANQRNRLGTREWMCSSDPGNLQGIEIDHPACNIQNDHFSACGEQ